MGITSVRMILLAQQNVGIVVLIWCSVNMFGSAAFAQSSWNWQSPLPQGNDLYGIHVFDSQRALAVGANAVVVSTANGGTSWDVRPSAGNVSTTLRSVD